MASAIWPDLEVTNRDLKKATAARGHGAVLVRFRDEIVDATTLSEANDLAEVLKK